MQMSYFAFDATANADSQHYIQELCKNKYISNFIASFLSRSNNCM